MSLKNLKSVFSNIELPSPTPEKQGVDTNPSLSTPEKQSPTIQSSITSNLTTMTSAYSLDPIPGTQEVDFMGGDNSYYYPVDPQIPGFTANYTLGGYTYNDGLLGNSLFIGTPTGGHTQYGKALTLDVQQSIGLDFMTSSPLISGFTSNFNISGDTLSEGDKGNSNFIGVDSQFAYNDNVVNFLGGNNSYYSAIQPPVPGFTKDFTNGGYNYSIGNPGESNFIDIVSNTHTERAGANQYPNQFGESITGNIYSSNTPYSIDNQISNFNQVSSAPLDGGSGGLFNNASTNWGGVNNNIPTQYTISGYTHPGPVDFMSGENSYYSNVDPEVSGFTNGFNLGGYTFAEGEHGNSHFIDITSNTHTEYGGAWGNTFSEDGKYRDGLVPDRTSGFNLVDSAPADGGSGGWFDATSTNWGSETNQIPNQYIINGYTHPGPVDFMDGVNLSSYGPAHSLAPESGVPSGFDIEFTSNGASGASFGSSKYNGLISSDNMVLSSRLENMWTGLDAEGNYNATGAESITDPSTYSTLSDLIPIGGNEWSIVGNYYDSIHSSFPDPTAVDGLTGTYPGPDEGSYLVNFMNNADMNGFISIDATSNSLYPTMPSGDDFRTGTTWNSDNSATNYYDSIHSAVPSPTSITGLSGDTPDRNFVVNFMDGTNFSSYGTAHSKASEDKPDGFTIDFSSNLADGGTGQGFGSTKYVGMMSAVTDLEGDVYSSRLENIYTNDSNKMSFGDNVNFISGDHAGGFKSRLSGTEGTSLFSGMPDDNSGTTWTSPTTTYYDNYTFNLPTYEFSSQQSTGLNFLGTDLALEIPTDIYATGFTVNKKHLSHTDFIGIPESIDSARAEWDPITTSYYDNYSNVPSSLTFASQQTDGLNWMGDNHSVGFTPSLTRVSDTQFKGVTSSGDDLSTGLTYTKPSSLIDDTHDVIVGFPNTNTPGDMNFTAGQTFSFQQQRDDGTNFIVGKRTDIEGVWEEWLGFNPDYGTPGNTNDSYSWWSNQVPGLSSWLEEETFGEIAPDWKKLPDFDSLPNNRILPLQSAADLFDSSVNFKSSPTSVGYGPDATTAGTKNALTIGSVVSDPIFLATQLLLQFHNPRNQRIWNPLSIASGIPIGPINVRISRGNFLGLFNTAMLGLARPGGGTEKYTNTVAELRNAGHRSIGTGNKESLSDPGYFDVITDKNDIGAPNSVRGNAVFRKLGQKFSGGVAYQVIGDNAIPDGDGNYPTSLLDVAPGLIHPTLGIAGDLLGAADWSGVEEFLNNYGATRQQYVTRDKKYKSNDRDQSPLIINQTKGDVPMSKLGIRKTSDEDNSFGSFSKLKQSLTTLELGDYSSIPETTGNTYSTKITKASYTSDTNWTGYYGQVDDSITGDTDITRPFGHAPNRRFGDLMTVLNPSPGANPNEKNKADRLKLEDQFDDATKEKIESAKYGMPMYFKDLRDNKYITFRAYLTGISENLNPQWNTHEYVGRSEPVYRYQSTQREINFTLSLFAHTRDEFEVLHMKLNRVTSMCYPEYMKDEAMAKNSNLSKVRMKPPIVKLRIGEWLGNSTNDGLTGFIQTLATTIPEESPWETERNYRSPKMFQLTFQFKVIHGEVPALIKQESMSVDEASLQASSYQDFYGFTGYETSNNGST